MDEISVKEFVDALSRFSESDINYEVKFISPNNKLLTLNKSSVYTENPDFYVLVDFVNVEEGGSITLSELIGKFKGLGDDYSNTFIDFLQPNKKSMIIQEDSIYVSNKGDLVIKFHKWTPER